MRLVTENKLLGVTLPHPAYFKELTMGCDAEARVWAGIKVDDGFLMDNLDKFKDCLTLEEDYLEAIWKDEDVSLFRAQHGFEPDLICASDEIIGFGTVILKADWEKPESIDPHTFSIQCLQATSAVRRYLLSIGLMKPASVYLSADYS